MKTPEELKESLDACFVKGSCAGCDYIRDVGGIKCVIDMCKDAKAYIEQLEETIQLMKIQMHGDCGVCKHRDDGERCATCLSDTYKHHMTHPLWEYEGLPELARKENK